MKKTILFPVLLLLVVGLYSCKEDNFQFGTPSCAKFEIPEEGHIGMCCQITNGGLSDSLIYYSIENKTQYEMGYFEDFFLEFYNYGYWDWVAGSSWLHYTSYDPIIIKPGETVERVLASKSFLISLIKKENNSKPGMYRIGFGFYVNGDFYVEDYYWGNGLYSEFSFLNVK